MSRLSLVVILTICALLHFAQGVYIEKYADGQYEINDGDCDSALARDVVYTEYLIKSKLLFQSREAKSSWNGTATIYCLKVHNGSEESEGSTCEITDGGVGFDHVTIEMLSKMNHGLIFTIQIFAK